MRTQRRPNAPDQTSTPPTGTDNPVQPRWRAAARWTVLTLYLTALATVTLLPAPWAEAKAAQIDSGVLSHTAWLSAQTWTTGSPPEFVLNVLLFTPAGLLISHWGARRATVLAAALTLTIEIAQIPITGRISDPRDLIANIAGTLLGIAIATWARQARRRKPHARNN